MITKPYEFIPHITQYKTPVEKFDEMDWKQFIPVYINKALSSNPALLDLIDKIQQYSNVEMSPQQLYSIYLEYIPVDRKFYKFFSKTKAEEINPLIIQTLAKYYETSFGEAKQNYYLQSEEETKRILSMYGITDEDLKTKSTTKTSKKTKKKK